jgi:hypothetical protein
MDHRSVERKISGSETRQRAHVRGVRLTLQEDAMLNAKAQAAGISVGAYIRATALGDAGPRSRRRPIIERELLARLLGHLGKVGSNLNQIAAAVNSGDELDQLGLTRGLADVAAMREAVFEALGREP